MEMAGLPAISLTSGLSKLNVTVLFDIPHKTNDHEDGKYNTPTLTQLMLLCTFSLTQQIYQSHPQNLIAISFCIIQNQHCDQSFLRRIKSQFMICRRTTIRPIPESDSYSMYHFLLVFSNNPTANNCKWYLHYKILDTYTYSIQSHR